MIEIYDNDGKLIARPLLTENAERVEELMSADYLQLQWLDDEGGTLPAGAYVSDPYNGERLSLMDPYEPEQKDEATFDYRPKFQSRVMRWGKVPFFHYTYSGVGVISAREPDWTLTDNAANFMAVVCRAIENETGERWTYEVDASLTGTPTISFTATDIFSGLNSIADAFATEWLADKTTNTLRLGKAQYGTAVNLTVGCRNADGSITDGNVFVPTVTNSREGYYNRFYVFGSTRNITQDYQGANVNNLVNKRLTLDPAKYPSGYIDTRASQSDTVYSKVLTFDEVYPHSGLKVADVRPRLMYRLDTDGNKVQVGTDANGKPVYDVYSIWYFKAVTESGEQFKINDSTYSADNPDGQLIAGLNLSVHFKTGAMTGREFELIYHPKAEKLRNSDGTPFEVQAGDYEVKFIEESGFIIPAQTGIVPADGDAIILFNIRMPEQYIATAYLDLEKEALKAIDERYRTNLNNYTVKSNPVAFHDSDPALSVGRRVIYRNGKESLETRVIKLVRKLDIPSEQEITIGNEKIKGNTQTLKEEVVTANSNIDLLTQLNQLTQSVTQAYQRTQQLMLDGFARIGRMWEFDPDDPDVIFTRYNFYGKGWASLLGKNPNAGTVVAGATTLGGLTNVVTGADDVQSVDKILVRGAGASGWELRNLDDIVGLDTAALQKYLTGNKYATQDWVRSQGYLTGHQSLVDYLTKTEAAQTYQPKGNYLTQHQAIYALTMTAGKFVAGSYNPAAGAASVNVPTNTSHLTNDSDYTTNAALNAAVSNLNKVIDNKLDRSEFEELFEKVTLASGKTAIRAKFALYSNDWMSALGANPDGGTGTGGDMDEAALEAYLTQYGYATQQWVRSQGYLTVHQDISHLLSKTLAAATYLSKTDAASTYLSKTDAQALYQPKGSYLTTTAAASTYLSKTDAAAQYQPKGNYLTSHQALNHINYLDRRSTNIAPYATGQYLGVEYQLKSNSADGLNDGQSYHGVLNLHAWRDSTGGAAHQMAFTDNGSVWLRHGREAWAAWRRLAFVSDIAWGNVSGKPNLVTLDTAQPISGFKTIIAASPTGPYGFNVAHRLRDAYSTSIEVSGGNYTMGLGCHKNGSWYWWRGTTDPATISDKAYVMEFNGTMWQYYHTLQTPRVNLTGGLGGNGYITASAVNEILLSAANKDMLIIDGANMAVRPGVGVAGNVSLGTDVRRWSNVYANTINVTSTGLVGNLNADMLDGAHNGDVSAMQIKARDVATVGVTVGTAKTNALNAVKGSVFGKCCVVGADFIHNFTADSHTVKGSSVYTMVNVTPGYNGTTYGQYLLFHYASFNIKVVGRDHDAWTSVKTIAFTEDNVASATRLQGTYSLWGQSFYGNNVSGNMTGVGSITAIADSSYDVGTASNQFKWGYFHGIYAKVGSWLGLGANNTDHIRIDTNGNVGIGTTAPAHKLDVAGDIHASGWLRTTGQRGWFSQTYGGGWYMTDDMYIKNYNSKRLQICGIPDYCAIWINGGGLCCEGYQGTSWGRGFGGLNVGIYSNPSQTPLIVAYRQGQHGSIMSGGANRLFALELLNAGTEMHYNFGGTARFKMYSDGRFYIQKGGYSDGYMSALGQNTGSDIRLKTWIADVALPLGVIAEAPAWIFRWRPEVGVMAGRIDAGTTAQYWQQWLPQVVSKREDNYLQIDYAKTALLSAIMIARYMRDFTSATDRRIMQLEATCRSQADEIEHLKTTIKDMERRLAA